MSNQQTVLITGATGLMGRFLLKRLEQRQLSRQPFEHQFYCLVRQTSDTDWFESLSLPVTQLIGDCEQKVAWQENLQSTRPQTLIHIASIRHIPPLLNALEEIQHFPRLIIIGTTGIYSKYNQYSAEYKLIEQRLQMYSRFGTYCLLRPTMIYGSHLDKNLHKLIKFCDRYSFFPVFGPGENLLQPVHADDLAQALLAILLNPEIAGEYDLSGGTVITFNDLIKLVGDLLGQSVRPLRLPYRLGLWSATGAEKILGRRSPVRREQILRLQEDKAYSYAAAARDFDYAPRSLAVGLQQEVEILRAEGLIAG